MSGNLEFGILPIILRTDERSFLCFNGLDTCFPSGSLGFWCVLGRGCLRDQPPVKTLGTESLMSFPGHRLLLEESSSSEGGSWERLLGAHTWSPPDSTPSALPFVDFALYPVV